MFTCWLIQPVDAPGPNSSAPTFTIAPTWTQTWTEQTSFSLPGDTIPKISRKQRKFWKFWESKKESSESFGSRASHFLSLACLASARDRIGLCGRENFPPAWIKNTQTMSGRHGYVIHKHWKIKNTKKTEKHPEHVRVYVCVMFVLQMYHRCPMMCSGTWNCVGAWRPAYIYFKIAS